MNKVKIWKIRENVFNSYVKNMDVCDSCYYDAEDENIDEIYDNIDDIININTLFAKTSIILLTANKYEKNILHKRIRTYNSNKIKRIRVKLFTACERYNELYAYWFEFSNYSILHIHSNVTGAYTIGGSADIVRWVLANPYLFPNIIISFGVCFGTKENKCKLGDVIISKKVYPYFIGAKIKGEELDVVDDNAFSINSMLLNKINSLFENNKFNNLNFKVYFNNYITGEAVVSSYDVRDKFVRTTTQEILAGDMEGYGLFKECKGDNYNIPCMIIKSICDWGAEKNFDSNDSEVIQQLNETIKKYSLKKSCINETEIIGTLKQRLQAYSASNAFEILRIMLENDLFDISLLGELKKWLQGHTGIATSCMTIKKTLCEIPNYKNMGFRFSDKFVHRCLMILEDEGAIECLQLCNKENNSDDICLTQLGDASIRIRNNSLKEISYV